MTHDSYDEAAHDKLIATVLFCAPVILFLTAAFFGGQFIGAHVFDLDSYSAGNIGIAAEGIAGLLSFLYFILRYMKKDIYKARDSVNSRKDRTFLEKTYLLFCIILVGGFPSAALLALYFLQLI